MENGGTWATPVFWFLKGVEGFDTSRADDCARKLNEKHYDTIAVLKLAEKRDLVEDAGILPGDALRIVVAARAYVPPCGPPFRPVKRYQKHPRPSEPPTPQEHHQDAITAAVEQLQKAYQAACSLTPSSRASDSTSPEHSDSWGSDLTLRALQLGAPASIFQAVPQQPPPGTSYSTFRASPQHKGTAVSQQVSPKSEAVKDPTVPLLSTVEAFPQEQPRASEDSAFKPAIPQQQQQQPGASDSVPQQPPPKASDSTLLSVPQQEQQQQQASNFHESFEVALRELEASFEACIQQLHVQKHREHPRDSESRVRAIPRQQQTGVSNSNSQAVPQPEKGTAVSQLIAPKSEAVKDPTSVPLPSIIQAVPQQGPPPKATNLTLLSVPQQQQARASDPSILQVSLQASPQEQNASFQANPQQLHSAADSQQAAPNPEAVKGPSVPLPSTIQAFRSQQQPRAADATFKTVPQQQQPSASDATSQAVPQQQQLPPKASNSTLPADPQQPSRASSLTFQAVPQQQQQRARVSDPKLHASLQEQNASFQAYVQEQSASFLAYVQQLHGGEVSQQVAPKSETVKNPTVPLPSTFQAVSQQQTRASNLTAQAVPQQQQQPGASPSTLQAVPQQQAKASDSTAQASPQQQPKASVLNSQTFPQQQARASDSTAQSVPQQQPRASDSASQAVSQQQDPWAWRPPVGDDHSPRAPISTLQKSYEEMYWEHIMNQGAAVSQQAAPKPESVKGPSVPLPSTIQAFPSQQQPRAADSTFKTVPQQQQPSASDATLQAVPQQQQQPPEASNSTLPAVPQQQQARASDPSILQASLQEQNASFQANVQQLHGGEVSQQVALKSEAVKNPTVPLPSAVSQQQTRASNLTAQAVPQQQQPGASPSTLQAVPQQQAKASDSTAQASPQQQPKASVLNSESFPQQPRASESTAQSVPQQQPRASDSASQAVSQQQIPWGPPLGDDHPPRAPISAIQAPPQEQKPQKSCEENCTGHHGSSQKDNHSGGVGPFGVIPSSLVKYPHICRLCNVMCINENQYITHYSCQRHYEALDLQRRSPPQQPHSEHPPRTGDRTPEHVCGVCDIWCRSEFDLRSHFDGNKHAKNMKLAIDSKDNRHTTYLNCSICDVLCNSKWNLVQHLNGKRHALNMEEDSEDDYSEGSSYYSE